LSCISQEHLPPWKVLIVDDEPDVITTTRHTLMDVTVLGRPLELLTAESAASAESLLQQHADVAVVLLDVVMEKIQSGLTLIDRVRNDFNNPGIRIILRTGKAGEAPEQAIVFRLYATGMYFSKMLSRPMASAREMGGNGKW
jgi:CheY-like chemotaxis protein